MRLGGVLGLCKGFGIFNLRKWRVIEGFFYLNGKMRIIFVVG